MKRILDKIFNFLIKKKAFKIVCLTMPVKNFNSKLINGQKNIFKISE